MDAATEVRAALAVLERGVRDLDPSEVPALVVRLAAIMAIAGARLAAGTNGNREPLIDAKEAARRLGVGVDWVRDHGAEKGIEVRLSAGTVRYDPPAVDRLREARAEARK